MRRSGRLSCSPSTPSSLFDGVFVINLDHRVDRWRHISSQLSEAGIAAPSIQRFPAVSGASVSVDRLQRGGYVTALGAARMRLPEAERVWGMDLTPGALGCAMSHFRLWALIARANLRAALVVEDDSLFPADFVPRFSARWRHVPADWELVYVSGLDTAGEGHRLTTASPHFRRVHPMHRTTNCYVVCGRGAQALLDAIPPITFQLDTELGLRTATDAATGLPYVCAPRCYSMHPPLVVQATRFGSDIQNGNPADPVEEERSRIAAAQW